MNTTRLSLHWKWFGAIAFLLILFLLAINLSLDLTLPAYLRQKIQADLERHARLTAELVRRTPATELNAATHHWAERTGLRFTIIARDGSVLGESGKAADQLPHVENHRNRPEVQAALKTGLGVATRPSDTVNVDLLYVALADAGRIIRVAQPLHEIAATTRQIRRTVAGASLLVTILVLPLAYWVARRTTAPITAMRHMAARVAAGHFTDRAPEHAGGEIGALAGALNSMSQQLETRVAELTSEKAHLAGILTGMTEGVLVVDAAGKVRLMNHALRQAFQLTDDALGKTGLEVFRHAGLDELLATPGARELTFLHPTDRTFTVQAGNLTGGSGVVVVFHDITRLKQLENVRKDFVANVSHELRTPLSIIKGYIETLLDPEPPDATTSRQFLETIQRHSRRLETLIDDLLSISALESQEARLEFAPAAVRSTATGVIEELAHRAAEKQTTLTLDIPADLPPVRADVQRLHQVLVNLIDNAIKYTPAGSQVRVSAAPKNGFIEICIADNGPGIAPEHLPRVFERFYRVDKARSRELGGTGLGLAIVKHIIQAHAGKVWVESEMGKGSRFYVTLPTA
ncbi:MAG: Alkaline phosphatase synthesis sensor protein PhoR [Verrucomicrobiae bacterium]|nr:Alkaline phosphatase synthesis sensor protein PhoR [Verrucomicrobiae bacterium]